MNWFYSLENGLSAQGYFDFEDPPITVEATEEESGESGDKDVAEENTVVCYVDDIDEDFSYYDFDE
jgi:hypothetical protein